MRIILLALLLLTGCDKLLDITFPPENFTPLKKADDSAQAAAEEAAERKSAAANQDAEAQRVLDNKNEEHEKPVDTVEFFANPEKYMIWKGDRDGFKKLFEEIRAAGAPATHAVCSDTFGKMVAASFIITLPQDPAARKKVIELHNGFWTKMVDLDAVDIDPQERDEYRKEMLEEIQSELIADAGQKYIMLTYDP